MNDAVGAQPSEVASSLARGELERCVELISLQKGIWHVSMLSDAWSRTWNGSSGTFAHRAIADRLRPLAVIT